MVKIIRSAQHTSVIKKQGLHACKSQLKLMRHYLNTNTIYQTVLVIIYTNMTSSVKKTTLKFKIVNRIFKNVFHLNVFNWVAMRKNRNKSEGIAITYMYKFIIKINGNMCVELDSNREKQIQYARYSIISQVWLLIFSTTKCYVIVSIFGWLTLNVWAMKHYLNNVIQNGML